MATVRMFLAPEDALYLGTAFPQYTKFNGTNMPVSGLAYDGGTFTENAHWQFPIIGYGSGNIVCTIWWYADTSSTGGVVWQAALRALTPDTDTQDIETDAYATAQQITDTHLGTTGQRLHTCALTITNLDSVANLDLCTLRITRLPTDAADTLAGDAIMVAAILSYSDV